MKSKSQIVAAVGLGGIWGFFAGLQIAEGRTQRLKQDNIQLQHQTHQLEHEILDIRKKHEELQANFNRFNHVVQNSPKI
jgi:gas vesicle protein